MLFVFENWSVFTVGRLCIFSGLSRVLCCVVLLLSDYGAALVL